MKKKEREGGREEGRKGRRKKEKEKAQTEELNGHFCLYYQLCSVKAAEGGSIPPVSKQQSSPAIYPSMVLHSSFSHIKELPLIPPPN